MVKKKAAPVATSYARSSAALEHGAHAAGARFIRRGFAFTPDADLELALGYPHFRVLLDGHSDDERAAEIAKAKILDGTPLNEQLARPSEVAMHLARALASPQVWAA